MIELFSYQQKAIECILSDPCHSQLISMPTGTGKTITFLKAAEIIKKKCLILVHREELLNQTYDKAKLCGFKEDAISLISSESKPELKSLNIGMVQSLARNLNRYRAEEVEMMIVDEAHHSTADSYREIFDHFKVFDLKKILLGFTATPLRGDKKCLSSIYSSHSYKMTLAEATQNGYICPVHGVRVQIDKELSDIENTGGDYKLDQLDKIMNCEAVNRVVADRCQHLERVPAIIFCTSVDHAQKISDLLNEKERKAAVVSYKSTKKELESIFERLKKGELEFITNAVKLSEGFDYPPIQTIVSIRPTRSPVLYKQMIGRGLRKSEGKYDCLVMEFCGNDPNMICWEDIDQNSTFQSFTESQRKSREDAIGFYRNRFGNPDLKIMDVRLSPFQFYECKIRRFCKYKKNYRYIPFTDGFMIGEMRPQKGAAAYGGGNEIFGYLCLWRRPFKSFYVWDGGAYIGNKNDGNNQELARNGYMRCFQNKDLERNLLAYADHQPDPLGKWYPSEEEPMTAKQKNFFKNPLKLSARKAEMHLEDCAIKQAIERFWIQQKMPDIDSDAVKEGTATSQVYELTGVY